MSSRILTHRLVLAGLLILSILPGCGGGGSGSRGPRRAIFIMLDAARPDRFSCYGYPRGTTPHMDALAADGLLFRNHFAQATYTRASLPTLFQSRYFAKSMFPASAAIPLTEPDDLFRVPDAQTVSLVGRLREAGLSTVAVSAHPWIKPGTDFADDFETLHDLSGRAPPGRIHPNAEILVDDALAWLEAHGDEDYFMYMHMMDTHTPHYFDADAQAYFGAPVYEGDGIDERGNPRYPDRILSREDRRYLDALYDGGLRYCDRQLGRIFDWLAARGELDDTLILITADHGEHLMEAENRFGHAGEWFDAVARIPLILHDPHKLAPGHVDRPTEGVDVLPTVLSLLDVDIPAGKSTDGIDLVPYARGEFPPKPYVMARQSIRSATHKAIFEAPDAVLLSDAPPAIGSLSGKLYDLREDHLEIYNLWDRDPDVAAGLLDAYRVAMRPRFARYQAAIRFTQPKVPFALGTQFARIEGDVTTVHRSPALADLSPDGSGWLHSDHASKHWLLGRPGAAPCAFEIAVPSGEYRLSARVMGRGLMTVAGADTTFTVAGVDLDPDIFAQLRETHIGYVEVVDDVFRARLEVPADSDGFFLRILGFSPIGADEDVTRDQAMDEARIERLRSLGYVD